MTTLTCDHCDSEIDVAKDPKCVVASVTGHADVTCEACRMHAWDRWNAREAYKIKRGWLA